MAWHKHVRITVIIPSHKGLAAMSAWAYAAAGLLASFGFMAGELPNSFLKRQCGIPSGGRPRHLPWRVLTAVIDRIDSILGMLVILSLLLPVPWRTWVYLLAIGPGVHFLFSAWLFRLRVKARPG